MTVVLWIAGTIDFLLFMGAMIVVATRKYDPHDMG